MTDVVVDDHLFEKQGWKYVMGVHDVLKVPPGEVAPTDQGNLVRDDWEPLFAVRLPHPVTRDEDVPDSIGFAMRKAADRLMTNFGPDAGDDPESMWFELIGGPFVHEGELVLALDTDGVGCTREMVEDIGNVLAEELAPCGVQLEITAGRSQPGLRPAWRSTTERGQ